MIVAATFAALVALRYGALLVLAALIVRPIRDCPACFAATTIPVRYRWLRPVARHYEWRWCPSCGWQAVARRVSVR